MDSSRFRTFAEVLAILQNQTTRYGDDCGLRTCTRYHPNCITKSTRLGVEAVGIAVLPLYTISRLSG